MNISYLCLLIAGLLPYAAICVAKARRDYDNRDPRGWLEKQTGFRRRAHHAHLNAFEAFPFFAAGVIVANLAQSSPGLTAALAAGFVASRILHLAFYLADQPTLRALAFTGGLVCAIGLFVIGLAGTV